MRMKVHPSAIPLLFVVISIIFFFYVPEIASDKEMKKLLVAMFSRFFYYQLFGERV